MAADRRLAAVLRAQAATLAALADELEREADGDGDGDQLLDARQVAELAHRGRRSVLQAIARGELPAVVGGRGKRLVRRSDALAWMSGRRVVVQQTNAEPDDVDQQIDRMLAAGRLRRVK